MNKKQTLIKEINKSNISVVQKLISKMDAKNIQECLIILVQTESTTEQMQILMNEMNYEDIQTCLVILVQTNATSDEIRKLTNIFETGY